MKEEIKKVELDDIPPIDRMPTQEQRDRHAAFKAFCKIVDVLEKFEPAKRVDILDRILIFHGYKAIPK